MQINGDINSELFILSCVAKYSVGKAFKAAVLWHVDQLKASLTPNNKNLRLHIVPAYIRARVAVKL